MRYWYLWVASVIYALVVLYSIGLFVFEYGWPSEVGLTVYVFLLLFGLFTMALTEAECDKCHYLIPWPEYMAHRWVIRSGQWI